MVAVKESVPVIEPQRRQLNFVVTERVYQGVLKQASRLGLTPTRYAQILFEAAYAARTGGTGDASLEDVVGGTLILLGHDYDTATIAKALKTTEPRVVRIVEQWKSRDRSGRKAA